MKLEFKIMLCGDNIIYCRFYLSLGIDAPCSVVATTFNTPISKDCIFQFGQEN